jgi:hypothetical protein
MASHRVQARVVPIIGGRERAFAVLLVRYQPTCREWSRLIGRRSTCWVLIFHPINGAAGTSSSSMRSEGLMPFVEIAEVATTTRQKLTAHQRLRIWERAAGVCVLCEREIAGVRER